MHHEGWDWKDAEGNIRWIKPFVAKWLADGAERKMLTGFLKVTADHHTDTECTNTEVSLTGRLGFSSDIFILYSYCIQTLYILCSYDIHRYVWGLCD